MNDFELQINAGSITTNLDSLKTELQEIADKYKGLVITEEQTAVAKKDLASLRKVRKSVDDRRKMVKSEWNKPYETFEKQVKEAIAIIDAPINEIDKKLKDFEAEEKKRKQEHCKQLFTENVGDLAEFITYESVYRDTWLNKSTTDNEIISDISGARVKVKTDIDAITALNSEFHDELIEVYKRTGQLTDAIQRNTQLISAKQLAEKKAEEDAQAKIEAERRAREEAEQKAAEAEKRAEEAEKKAEEPFNEESKKDYAVFTVRVKNEEQAQQVRQFCEFSDIQYSVIF